MDELNIDVSYFLIYKKQFEFINTKFIYLIINVLLILTTNLADLSVFPPINILLLVAHTPKNILNPLV